MKGTIFVKELNNTGVFISGLDYDKSFSEKGNTKGYFKMLIEPIKNANEQYEIQYKKVKKGFLVDGEAYIITGKGEKTIDKKINKDFGKDVFPNLIFTENEKLN